MNEDALGGKALGAVTGDGVAVVEMTMLTRVDSLTRSDDCCLGGQSGDLSGSSARSAP